MDVTFTEQQSQCLQYLRKHHRAAVAGCAGSGKTLLAVQFARELDEGGMLVLLLCRNPFLAEKLRGQLQNTTVQIFAITQWIRYLNKAAHRPDIFLPREPPGWEAPWTQYDAPSHSQIYTALDTLARLFQRFDAVILDQANDFEASWLDVAEASLADEEKSRFVLFYDDNPLLAHFSPLRSYADIQAPVALSENRRSVEGISALVQQLRSYGLLATQEVEQQGAVREWLYSSEAELFDHLQSALQAAEEQFPGLKDVVVITAETNPGRLSKLAGLVIDSPCLVKAAPERGLNWQSAVLRSLQGFGLLESDLSAALLPTAEDIRHVNRFCAAYQASHRRVLSHQQSYAGKYALKWHLDSFGELSLHREGKAGLDVSPVDLLRFFAAPGWAAALPPAYQRYRLTPPGVLVGQPYYQDVYLTDIPSFSGLEAGGVVFVLYNYFVRDNDEFLGTLYLALSRARKLLYIISPNES